MLNKHIIENYKTKKNFTIKLNSILGKYSTTEATIGNIIEGRVRKTDTHILYAIKLLTELEPWHYLNRESCKIVEKNYNTLKSLK